MAISQPSMARQLLVERSCILADFDETLVATFQVRSITLRRAARSFGVEIDAAAIKDQWGKPFPELIAGILPAVKYEDFLPVYSAEMSKDIPVGQPGAERFLHYCRQAAKKVVIHSSSRTDLIAQDVAALGWSCLVEEIFGIDKTGFAKPDPRSLANPFAFFGESGGSASNMLYIGDSPNDSIVAGAWDVPMVCVLTGLVVDVDAFTPQTVFIQSLTELVDPD
jgi:phosphoglycolate phosphatase-like HAD superfamily hydrolase